MVVHKIIAIFIETKPFGRAPGMYCLICMQHTYEGCVLVTVGKIKNKTWRTNFYLKFYSHGDYLRKLRSWNSKLSEILPYDKPPQCDLKYQLFSS